MKFFGGVDLFSCGETNGGEIMVFVTWMAPHNFNNTSHGRLIRHALVTRFVLVARVFSVKAFNSALLCPYAAAAYYITRARQRVSYESANFRESAFFRHATEPGFPRDRKSETFRPAYPWKTMIANILQKQTKWGI